MADDARTKHAENSGQVPTESKWNDPAFRSLVFQAVALLGLGWFLWTIFDNTLTNMESRGITTGFGFLENRAGFGILMSLIPYEETMSYGRTFVVGLLNTILVSCLGIIIATVLGFIIGVARLSKNWLIAKMALVYIEALRNVPLLLQIFFWYFAVLQALPSPRKSMDLGELAFLNNRGVYVPGPVFEDGFGVVVGAIALAIAATVYIARWAHKRQEETGQSFPVFWAGIGLIFGLPFLVFLIMGAPLSWEVPELKGFNFQGGVRVIPELMALLWALSMYTTAFIAEIVRSGILSVSHGQTEAAGALGLRQGNILRLVVIPQAMRVIIPPLTSQYLNLTKNSSLATAIGYPDLVSVFMGTTLNQTGQAVEIVAMTMAVYLTISLTISFLMNWYNKTMALSER
ncbi:MAG: amino acid ABC transporter permease [Gammaproteobacteria bacterium]|nr:MAG: amino acid ABC transporter permease [Gammaproteobacteria bacterium]